MMWFTADLHLGDTNILHDMDRPFDSVEEMNRKVIDAINECVAADDRLYILGDFTYRLPMAEAVRLRVSNARMRRSSAVTMTATGKIPTPRKFGKTCAITWRLLPAMPRVIVW